MKLSVPTLAQAAAFGRHVISYAAGATTAAVVLHAVTVDQGNAITNALTQIASGVTTAAGGIATLVSVGAAIWAAHTASPQVQVAAVAAMPDTAKILARPGVAGAVADAAADPAQPKVGTVPPVVPIVAVAPPKAG